MKEEYYMKEEDIERLYKELCMRMPYGITVLYNKYEYEPNAVYLVTAVFDDRRVKIKNDEIEFTTLVENVTPLLRSFSDITKDEIYDAAGHIIKGLPNYDSINENGCKVTVVDYTGDFDIDFELDFLKDGTYGFTGLKWMLENHFDFNNLINNRLAKELIKEK
jgi:hypothetical protein